MVLAGTRARREPLAAQITQLAAVVAQAAPVRRRRRVVRERLIRERSDVAPADRRTATRCGFRSLSEEASHGRANEKKDSRIVAVRPYSV